MLMTKVRALLKFGQQVLCELAQISFDNATVFLNYRAYAQYAQENSLHPAINEKNTKKNFAVSYSHS